MRRSILLACLIPLIVAGCTQVRVYPEPDADKPAASTAASTSSSAATAAAQAKTKSPFKDWDDVTKDTRQIDGLFTTHLKRDQTLYLEIKPAQLDQDFGMVMHFDRGVGDFNLHEGLPLSDMQLMRFTRVGDQIYLVHRNPRFTADADSPIETSMTGNVGHSIAEAFKIESQHDDSKALLIDVTGFFASDYPDVSNALRPYLRNTPARFDKQKSFVERVMGFPKNVEIDATLSYAASRPPSSGGVTITDYRSIPITVRYSLVALPEDPMQPRYGDDRIGHFLTTVRDFSRDQADSPYLRYVERWRLEPKDPDALARGELTEPVEPIVYYIDRSVPHAYRPYVKAGIEAWQKAYEAAGFKNAIVAKEAPDDSTWSAEDARYSTVRWTVAQRMGYAIGPSQTDPRTGEILNADVLLSSEFVTGWRSTYQQLAADPTALFQQHEEAMTLHTALPEHLRDRFCIAALGKSHELAMQHLFLTGLGIIESPAEMPDAFLGEALKDLVMHEIGHTLGLRHNYKGSSAIPVDRLHDEAFTRENGVSLSVMEYAPVNVAADPEEQGHYYNVEVGSYDVWAIQYAYQPVLVEPATFTDGEGTEMVLASGPEQERAALQEIAGRAAEPLLAFSTDVDVYGPYAVDPLSNTWDLGSDPMAWALDRTALLDRVEPELEARLIEEGESYHQLRGAMSSVWYQRMRALAPAVRNVGGLYFARDHKGDPNARMPFTPVAADQQRAAVQFLVREAFAADAVAFDAERLNKLAPNRYLDWSAYSGGFSPQMDVPVHDMVTAGQGMLLRDLLNPIRLERMIDNEVRMPAGQEPYRVSELLQTLSGAIWSELAARQNPDSFRRNLQRMYTDHLIGLMVNDLMWASKRPSSPTQPDVPEHVRSLARLELAELRSQLDAALDAGALDRDTQAHYTETHARVAKALDAPLVLPVE